MFIFYRDNRLGWRLKPFIVKRLLVHLGGRYNVRTKIHSLENEIEIPIYEIPLPQKARGV